MKIALVAVAGAVAGLLGGTGWGAIQVRDALVAAHAATAGANGTAMGNALDTPLSVGEGARPDWGGEPALADSLQALQAAAPSPTEGEVKDSLDTEPAGEGAEDPAAALRQRFDPDGVLRLGKILGAMKPSEAAKVLLQLDDTEAVAVLVNMSDRQAAPILASLPAERAALLGRRMLAGRGGVR